MDIEEHDIAPATGDPGWRLHETLVGGEYAERWLYHFADLTVVDEEGTPFEPDADGVMVPVEDREDREDREYSAYAAREAEAHDEEPAASYDEEPATDPDPDGQGPQTGPDPAAEDAGAWWGQEPVDAAEARDPSRLSARNLALGSLVVSALLVLTLLAAVMTTRWGDSTTTVDTATPASQVQLPAAVAPDSEYVRSRVLPTGDIRVDHWLMSTRPVARLVLRPPAVSADGGSPVSAREVRVETPAGAAPGADTVEGTPQTYALDDAEQVHVRYLLSGAVTRTGTDSTRALARATSLDLSYPGGRVPRTVVVLGGRVRSAACTADADAPPRPCGQPEGRAWRVRLEPAERHDLVLAQLDLV